MKILKWTGLGLVGLVLLALAVIYGVSEYKLTRTYDDVPLTAIVVPHDAASVAEGKRLVGVYHCGSCHNADYRGREFMNVDLLATLIAPNLTTKIPTYTDPELARLVRHAIKKDGSNAWMFASGMYTPLTDADLGKMIGYLRTLKPVAGPELGKNWYGPLGRALVVAGQFPIMAEVIDHKNIPPLGQDTTQLGRGKYLVMTACSGCHGGPTLKGDADEHMKSPPLVIAAAYKPDAFRHFLRTGEGGLGRKDCGMMSQAAKGFLHNLNDREIDAIHTYLQTLPNQQVAKN
jgi:mono/diheme cytochrome c family protein